MYTMFYCKYVSLINYLLTSKPKSFRKSSILGVVRNESSVVLEYLLVVVIEVVTVDVVVGVVTVGVVTVGVLVGVEPLGVAVEVLLKDVVATSVPLQIILARGEVVLHGSLAT